MNFTHIGQWYYSQEELRHFKFKHLGNNVLVKKNVNIFAPENVVLCDNVRIEDYCLIVASQAECYFGKNVHVASHCVILGRCGLHMEDFSGLSPHVVIVTASDDYSGNQLTNLTVPAKYRGGPGGEVVLRKHVIIGTQTTILQNLEIGEGAAVGAHSLVRKNVEPWGVYSGNPLRYIKKRSQQLLELEKNMLKEFA